MKKINIYGAPSSGKSTIAALLYGEMKIKNLSVELVREVAKEWVHANIDVSNLSIEKRLEILTQQIERETLFTNQVDYLITDAPILISTYYNDNLQALKLARDTRAKFQGQESNYFLESHDFFEVAGRSHGKEESQKIEVGMKHFLSQEGIEFKCLKGTQREIVEQILKLEHL